MLKKQNRLGKITKTKENKLFTSPLFNIRISDNKENKTRFAFIVSKKIDKRAVIRNRTKRVLRSAVEEIIEKLKTGKDIVIISKKALVPEQTKEVLAALESTFRKTGSLNI
jgi:ribonuclease P protein component